MTLKQARAILKSYGVNSLLADPTDNPKLAKSLGVRVYTAPLHLAPASLSGFNTCAMATLGCKAACLHTAGNPAYMAAKAKARVARTIAYFKAREAFMLCLVAEIESHVKAARRKRMRCGVRLNATSDIPWERVPCIRNGKAYASVMDAFPKVSYYDYTKRPNRRELPPNYKLTFSLAENNDAFAIQAIDNGLNVAAVFNVGRTKELPATYAINGRVLPVIDGDLHDYRPIDPVGVIVGLRAKGSARGDTSGFVRLV
jgi:hypothetical protein